MPIVLTPPPPAGADLLDEQTKKPTRPWAGWFRNVYNVMRPGVTKTVVIGGTTLTFVNGIFTGSSP